MTKSSQTSRRLSVGVISLSLALTACAAPGTDQSLSPEENQLRQSHARFNQTVAEGAGVGAVVGAAAGALLGGHNRLAGAAVGAAAGGALGAGAGYLVARNNAARSHSEADYRTAITEAEQQAADLRNSAGASRRIADRAQQDIQALTMQYRARQITAAQFRAQVETYRTDNQLIQQQAQDAETNIASLRSFAGGAGPYRQQIMTSTTDIEASRDMFRRSAATISQALSTVPQGA